MPGKGDAHAAGGEQVARDEQGVLHGRYASVRSYPSRSPPIRAPSILAAVAVGFI